MRASLRRLSAIQSPPIINISNATFFRNTPSVGDSTQPDASAALFPNLTFRLESNAPSPVSWAVLGASSAVRTTFLDTLRGRFQPDSPAAVSFPYLSSDEVARKDPRLRSPNHAIQYVGFDAERGARGLRSAYLSARYESHREASDFVLRDFLVGRTELNAADEMRHVPDEALFSRIVEDFVLRPLLDMPVSRLSNGQTRRSLIARALLCRPEVLMLNSPFSQSIQLYSSYSV
jgi:ATPase subunit of ABC transporter with duplicated ATPase domains